MHEEAEIKLAEKLGLTHKAPKMERRAFLRGMLATGALVATPAGLRLPEKRVYQVPRDRIVAYRYRDGSVIRLADGSTVQVRDGLEYRNFGDLSQLEALAANHKNVMFRLPRADAAMLPRDAHLEGAARALGISYDEAKARHTAGDPQVLAARDAQKIRTFGERYGASPAMIRDAIQRSLPPGAHKLVVDEVNIAKRYLVLTGHRVG